MEANKSSMKALLMNRVGDWGLTIGILYMYNVYNNYDYSVISGVGGVMPKEAGGYIMVMTIYILIGAIAKSAQIGQVKAYSLRIAGNSSNSFFSVIGGGRTQVQYEKNGIWIKFGKKEKTGRQSAGSERELKRMVPKF